MKILIVNSIDWVGGAEAWIIHLVRELGRRGHRLGVAHHPDSLLGERARRAGAWTLPMPEFGSRGASTGVAAFPAAARLARHVRREGYDLVVSTVRRDLKVAGLAARLAGHRGVVARLMSGWSPAERPVENGAAGGGVATMWRERRHRWYHRRLVHLAAANSRAGASLVVARGYLPAGRVVPIYNGVDLVRFDPDRVSRGPFRAEHGIAPTAFLVVSLSRFVAGKGQAYELEAVGRLAAGRPDVHVVFAGPVRSAERPYLRRLKARAATFPDAARIRFLDAQGDVPRVLADADVVLRCAISEGLPNIALEAMAMRVPVVATAICGTPEAVVDGETGRLVPPADADAIVRAVDELLSAPAERRAALGAAGRARVERHFTLSRMANRYETLFQRALSERNDCP